MVVNALNAARKDSALGPVVTDILNAAALRESSEDTDTVEAEVADDDLFSA